MEKYLQNPELLPPTEFVTTWRHANAVVRGKKLCLELTGYVGPFITRQQQGRSSSLSVVHADQELCGRAWLSRASPSDASVEYLLQMGHGGDVAELHLGASNFASLTHVESIHRFKPLNLRDITDDDLRRRLRGELRVESRVTTDASASAGYPAVVAADEECKEPWRRPDAALADAWSRRMVYLPKPPGKSSGQAPDDALAYRLRIDRTDERFRKITRGGAGTGELAEGLLLLAPTAMEVSWSDTPQANLLHAPAAAHSESAAETEAGAPTPTQSGGQRRAGQVAGAVAAHLTTTLLVSMPGPGATAHSPAHPPATTAAQSPALSPVRGGGGDERGGGDDDRTAVPPGVDHTARHALLAKARYACLALFVLPTAAQCNFDLRCQLLEYLLLCGVLWLVRCAAAPVADRMQRRAQWLLSLLRPYHLPREHIAACVMLLSHLWSRDWWGVTVVAVWFWAQGHRASTLATLTPRSCSWFERAQPWVRGLMAVIAYAEHAPTAPTTEQLRVLELQVLWEMTEFLVLRLLLRAVHWARTRLLRSLARRLDLDETEATRAD